MRSTDDIERDIAFHRDQLALLVMELAASRGEHGEGNFTIEEPPRIGYFAGIRLKDMTYTFNTNPAYIR